jgi:hypothetical protein
MADMVKMKKQNDSRLFILLIVVIIGAVVGLLVGVSLDGAYVDGQLDIDLMTMPDVTSIETYMKVNDENSRAKTGAIVGGFAGLIIVMSCNNKRLHRKGEEHGSSAWATLAEKQKLADKVEKRHRATRKIAKPKRVALLPFET